VVAQATDGTLRLYVAGQDDNDAALLRAWGRRNGLDGSAAFTTKVRARRTFGPGKYASSVDYPVMYFRNPQGDTAGSLSCTVSLVKDYNVETISETFTMDTTPDDNGISIKTKKLESLAFGEANVLDLIVSLTYSGTAFDSVVPPTIDAIVVPLKVQERF
jgi:hypothetical protein